MEACNFENAMEAPRQEQDRAGDSSADPRTILKHLTFLEQKIGHLRGIICTAPRQLVSAELSCIAVQLVSISRSLAAGGGATAPEDAKSPAPAAHAHEGDSDSSDHDHGHRGGDDEERLPPGSYEVIELDREEILAPHVHTCKVCGKGFKRDANLRMHMRGHGDAYKTAAALARPARDDAPPPPPDARTTATTRCFYSCPYVGCKRNREHRSFQPLKTAVCVRNHYRRSHCDKSYTCRRCNVKRFSVLADLRTHEKHCGRDRWVCSCGTSFSRKDKLFGHVAAFDGHAPALPPEEDDAADHRGAANGIGTSSEQQLMGSEAVSSMASMEGISDGMFADFSCSDIKGFPLTDDGRCLEDGRGFFSPMGLDYSCDFDGFDLFGSQVIDF
ncbi:hypothetical protein ACP70R_025807 [Stipagrostis hirtigluma subsp. patula]